VIRCRAVLGSPIRGKSARSDRIVKGRSGPTTRPQYNIIFSSFLKLFFRYTIVYFYSTFYHPRPFSRIHALSLSLSLSHTRTLTLALSCTHIIYVSHTLAHILALSYTHTHTFSLSLSLSHTHTHTHTPYTHASFSCFPPRQFALPKIYQLVITSFNFHSIK